MQFIFGIRCFVPSNMLNLLPNSSHISIYSLGFSVCTSLSFKNNGRVDFLSYVFLILALLYCLEPPMSSESGRYRHLCLIPNIKKNATAISSLRYRSLSSVQKGFF